ncbi:hypothetical protein M2271_002070 [Streptomyces sp. LBL]|nr:hypothetical protein [Streptomyces sp. LBL]
MIGRFGDGLLTPAETASYLESVRVIVIDPRFGHERPVVAANRVAVNAITDLCEARPKLKERGVGTRTQDQPRSVADRRVDTEPGRTLTGGTAGSHRLGAMPPVSVRHDVQESGT